MTTKYTPEDIQNLKLSGEEHENRQAMHEFCDVINTFTARLAKWRQRYAHLGADEAVSAKLQAKVASKVVDS